MNKNYPSRSSARESKYKRLLKETDSWCFFHSNTCYDLGIHYEYMFVALPPPFDEGQLEEIGDKQGIRIVRNTENHGQRP